MASRESKSQGAPPQRWYFRESASPIGKFAIEFDGENVHPHNLDTRRVVAFVDAYIDLLARAADDIEQSFALYGLALREKCALLEMSAVNQRAARDVANTAGRYLRTGQAPKASRSATSRAREMRERLPANYIVTQEIDDLSERLEAGEALRFGPWDRTTLRARLIRIGGKEPVARFESGAEDRPFSVDLEDMKTATDMSPFLYKEMDIDIRLRRDAHGFISECSLVEFDPVEGGGDPAHQAREWFAPQADSWRQIENMDEYMRSMRDE